MSYVYFARCGDYVKIGYSYRPQQRLKHLFGGSLLTCPDDLDRTQPVELIHLIDGCRMRDERIIHGLFAAHRDAGEWFRATDLFYEQLANLRYVTVAEQLTIARRARAEAKRRHEMPLPRAA